MFRPRLVAYGAVFLTMLSGLTYALANRVPLELDILRELGVTEVQGFLYSRPVSEAVFGALIESGGLGAA